MRRCSRCCSFVLLFAAWLALPAAALDAELSDGPSYAVGRFEIGYTNQHPGQLSVEDLLATSVDLGETPTGYVVPRAGEPTVAVAVGDVPPGSRFHASALQHVLRTLQQRFRDVGIVGVTVRVSGQDIQSPSGVDLRATGDTALTLEIATGTIQAVHTYGHGPRFDAVPESERVDHPAHRRIREAKQLDPGGLLRIDDIEDYMARLSRHPGRQAELRISPGTTPETAELRVDVTETKPWYAYVQASNTGTEDTTELRQRFGFVHNQLTDSDDILQLDYITGNFDKVHVVLPSYERPVFDDRLRLRIDGSWSQFDSSEFGFQFLRFQGEQWHAGATLSWNVFQYGPFFLDLLAGIRFQRVEVQQSLFDTDQSSNFLFPQVGLRIERDTLKSRLFGLLLFETNLANLANTVDTAELSLLGRVEPDRKFEVLRWNLQYSFYLEPWVQPLFGRPWGDPRTSTLAHEIAFQTEGQYSFGNRLVPEFEGVAGGLYTVRGYPQSLVAGDDVYIGTLEYRLHIPRLLAPGKPVQMPLAGRPFSVRPALGAWAGDWDLIFRLFFDAAYVKRSDALPFEPNETLRSTGAGLELQLLSNVSMRFDYGIALADARGGFTRKWDHEYHWVVTLLY